MKLIFIIILILSLFISCNKQIDISNLIVGKNELVYEKGTHIPFSGVAILKNNNMIITLWNYKNGKSDGICKNFYDNGNLKFYGEFKNGLPNGILKEYNSNGTLILEERYKNGLLNGEKKEFYDNGNLKNIETYSNDFLNGPRITYDINGTPKIKESYKLDELVETIIWPIN